MATNQNLPFSETEVDNALGYMILGVSQTPTPPPSPNRFVESDVINTFFNNPITVSNFTDESIVTSVDGLTEQSSNDTSFATTQAINESSPNYFTTTVNDWSSQTYQMVEPYVYHDGVTIPHGLGAVPREFWFNFECYNVTAGVDGLSSSIAQELQIRGITVGQLNEFTLDAQHGTITWADATNLYLKFDNNLPNFPSGNTYALIDGWSITHNHYFGYDHPVVPNSHRLKATAVL